MSSKIEVAEVWGPMGHFSHSYINNLKLGQNLIFYRPSGSAMGFYWVVLFLRHIYNMEAKFSSQMGACSYPMLANCVHANIGSLFTSET